MDLSLNPTQQLLKETARALLEKECPRDVMRALDNTETGHSTELWGRMAELGWMGIALPDRYGGTGGSLTDVAILCEEMGYACLPITHHSSSILGGLCILEAGNEGQKRALLPAVASGEQILALAFTEPNTGWGPEGIGLTATPSNGGFKLNGTKLLVPSAQVANQLVVVARTGHGRSPGAGITLILVDRNAPGLTCRMLSGWTGDKLNQVSFSNVEVSSAAVLGKVNRGWAPLQRVLDRATALLCAYMVGGCQRLADISVDYSGRRIAFGVPIGTFQHVQELVIKIINDTDAARLTTYEALWKLDIDRDDAAEAVSIAKAVASASFTGSAEAAHHIHGGVGADKTYGLYLYTKKARTLYDYLGNPAFHRKRIARFLEL